MRAMFAVLGFVVFYVATVAAIIGFAWLGVWLLSSLGSFRGGRGIIAIVLLGGIFLLAAGVLAWSALPRIDRFVPPGPEIDEAQQPALFAMLHKVAAATNQKMPAHVYVTLDVNAFVTERGGIMGIGSRRVMGIGLGLLNAFTVDEVRAIVAHEFGHFHGGDTRLGPWVYKTRAAMGRSVINLQKAAVNVAQLGSIAYVLMAIERPFRWMALGYMRLAAAVSRAQEYSADAVAARTVGTGPVVSGFTKIAGTAAAVDAYLDHEIGTLVEQGVLPPVLAGARQFVDANREHMAKLDEHARFGEVDAFDSHPPLGERIAAVRALGLPSQTGTAPPDPRFAIELVRFPEKLVRDLIVERVGKPLTYIEWDEVGPHFLRSMHQRLRNHRRWLGARSVGELDRSLETARTIARDLDGIGPHAHEIPPEFLQRLQGQIYFAALCVALEHVGYSVRTGPGEPLRFHSADHVIDPHQIVRSYLGGDLSDDDWRQTWTRAGLHDRPWDGVTWK